MAQTQHLTDTQLLNPARAVGSVVVVLNPMYTCSACSAAWPYRAVRNTGRCPECGSGLLRDTDCL